MSKAKSARRRYRPLGIAPNPVAIALRRARLIPKAEVDQVMAPIDSSLAAVRQGVGSESQWIVLAGSVELALAIERQRLGAICGIEGHLVAAETALAEIARRSRSEAGWRPVQPHLQEIDHLEDFTLLHRAQLEQISEGEFHKAHDYARAMVLASGGRAVDLRELQVHQEQLQLLGATQ